MKRIKQSTRQRAVGFIPTVVCAVWMLQSVFLCGLAQAAPLVKSLNVRGLQIGGTTTLVFDGAELLPDPRVVMAAPIAAQQVLPGATATRVEIAVTLDAAAQPGLYNLYLANEAGLSAKTLIAVDRLKQQTFDAPIDALPVALHGKLSGSAMMRASFAGKAGQHVVCEVEAARLGGKLRPVLHLNTAQGQPLNWSLPMPNLHGDTRLDFTLPADGQYTVSLNDLAYAGADPNQFRLKIGDWQYADLVFPSAVERGKPAALRLIGNVPPAPANVQSAADAGHVFAPWPDPTAASGPRPVALVSDMPEWAEMSQPSEPHEVAVFPAALNGWIAAPGQEDRYVLKVQPGSKLHVEVFAQRIGSHLDSMLQLVGEKGNVLIENDDLGTSPDSALDYTVPAEVSALTLSLRDRFGGGGDSYIYRIVITPVDKPASTHDFRLLVEPEPCNIPTGGRQVLKVRLDRRGYEGPVQLEFDRLAPGIQAEGLQIPAGASATLVTLSGGNAASQWFATLRGKSLDPQHSIVRVAQSEPELTAAAPVLSSDELALAVAGKSAIALDVGWQSSPEAKLVLGSKPALKVHCARPVGFDGPVRVTLLSSQSAVRTSGNLDQNRTLRSEPGPTLEIPADGNAQNTWNAKLAADKVLADAQTAQAAAAKVLADAQGQQSQNGANPEAAAKAVEAATKAKADVDKRVGDAQQKQTAALAAAVAAAAAAKNELEFKLFVPAELPELPQGLALRAELLSRDKQVVLATACTPVQSLNVVNPLAVQYTGLPKAQGMLDAKTGASVKLTGKIERREGLASEVAVTLVGLPPGIAVPRIALKPDQTDYELEIKFPPTFAAGEVHGVRIVATGKLDPQAPLENRSSEVAVNIELVPAP